MLQHGSDIHLELPHIVRNGDKHVWHVGRVEREGRTEIDLVRQNGGAEAQSTQELSIQQLRRLHPAQHQEQDVNKQRQEHHWRVHGTEQLVRQEASAYLEEKPIWRGERVDV